MNRNLKSLLKQIIPKVPILDKQAPLEGSLTKLLPLKKSDFDLLFAVASDPLIWEQHPQKNRYQKEIFELFFNEAMKSKGAYLIIEKKTNKIIGSSRYYLYDRRDKKVHLGFTFLARSHWGGEYNREIKQLMINHAFKNVKSIIFGVWVKNLRSQKALEKIGAKFFRNHKKNFEYILKL